MILRDYHVHTTFSDGKNTPEEMVLAAIEKGMTAIGFSDHSYTWFDESYCIRKEDVPIYRECIASLKEKYRDKIDVLCGIEQDFYSEMPTDGYDYVIGSVHYLKLGNEHIPVDESPEILRDAAKRYFGDDMTALAEEYYKTVSEVVERQNASIIGHFDLITIFNDKAMVVDENDPRYIAAYRAAADHLIETGKVFEINTGGVARGYRTTPYPSSAVMEYIRQKGGVFILSSDSHAAKNLCFDFEKPDLMKMCAK